MARKINVKLILELRYSGYSMNEIAANNHISKHSVCTVCKLAESLGLSKEKIADKDEEFLYLLLFPDKKTSQQFYEPVDYEMVHKELLKPGVTLKLLHEEYQDECRHKGKISVGYSKFCDDYDKFTGNRTNLKNVKVYFHVY